MNGVFRVVQRVTKPSGRRVKLKGGTGKDKGGGRKVSTNWDYL